MFLVLLCSQALIKIHTFLDYTLMKMQRLKKQPDSFSIIGFNILESRSVNYSALQVLKMFILTLVSLVSSAASNNAKLIN